MTVKCKRRTRLAGRPQASFGSLFTTVLAPAINAGASVLDGALAKHKANVATNTNTNTNTDTNSNTNNVPQVDTQGIKELNVPNPVEKPLEFKQESVQSDPTKARLGTRVGQRHKCWIGAAIGGLTSIAGSLFNSAAQKKQMRAQQRMQDYNTALQDAQGIAQSLNGSIDAQEAYLKQFRNAARFGKNLKGNITITDGGDAQPISNNTFLLRGGSHEDINETGQTGIGINVGGNQIEAEGGEVAQEKNGSLRIFSAQPILGNGMSPAQAVLRGYSKDKVFAAQQRFKRNNHLNDDGSKFGDGGYANNTPSPLDILNILYDKTLGRFDDKNPNLITGIAPTPGIGKINNLGQVKSGLRTKSMLPANRVYRITNAREVSDAKHFGQYRKMPDGVSLPSKSVKSRSGRTFSFGKTAGNSHGGKAASMGEPWHGTTSSGVGEQQYVISTPSRHTNWQVGHHGRYTETLPADAIKKGSGLWKKFNDDGTTGISTKRMTIYKPLKNGLYKQINKNRFSLGGRARFAKGGVTYKTETGQPLNVVDGSLQDSEGNNYTQLLPEVTITGKDLSPYKWIREYRPTTLFRNFLNSFQPKDSYLNATIPYDYSTDFNKGHRQNLVNRYNGFNFVDRLEQLGMIKDDSNHYHYKNPNYKPTNELAEELFPLADYLGVEDDKNRKYLKWCAENSNLVNRQLRRPTQGDAWTRHGVYGTKNILVNPNVDKKNYTRLFGRWNVNRDNADYVKDNIDKVDLKTGDIVDLSHAGSSMRDKAFDEGDYNRANSHTGTIYKTGPRKQDTYVLHLGEDGMIMEPIGKLIGKGLFKKDYITAIRRAARKDGTFRYGGKLDIYPRSKKAKGGWVKPVYPTVGYHGSKRVRQYIAKAEGSDFAKQNKQFKGDAISAKELELRNFMGKAYQHLNEGQRDALLSYYYNLKPKTFVNQYKGLRDRLINAQTEQEYNDTINAMKNSINVGWNNTKLPGLRNRRAVERSWFGYVNPTAQQMVNDKVNQIETAPVDNTMVQKPIIVDTPQQEVHIPAGIVPVQNTEPNLFNGDIKQNIIDMGNQFRKKHGLGADIKRFWNFIKSPRTPIHNIAALATAYQKLNPNSGYNKQKGKFGGGKNFDGSGASITWTDDYKPKKGFANFNDAYDDAVNHNVETFVFGNKRYNTWKENNPIRELNNRAVGTWRDSVVTKDRNGYGKDFGPIRHPTTAFPIVTETYDSRRKKHSLGGASRHVKGMYTSARPKAFDGTQVFPYATKEKNYWEEQQAEVDARNQAIDNIQLKKKLDNQFNGQIPYRPTDYNPEDSKLSTSKLNDGNLDFNDNNSRLLFGTGDYISLGADLFSALGTGIINYKSANNNVALPNRPGFISPAKLVTTYNITPQLQELKRMRDRLTSSAYNNTSSSVAALNRANGYNINTISQLGQLYADKENKETGLLNEDALNQQSVAEKNITNDINYNNVVAQLRNQRYKDRANALSVSLSGIGQAVNNFIGQGRQNYDDEQAMLMGIAASDYATPSRLIDLGVNLSPSTLAGIYRSIANTPNPGDAPKPEDFTSTTEYSFAKNAYDRNLKAYKNRNAYANLIKGRMSLKNRNRYGII